jgi:hypothetical protein
MGLDVLADMTGDEETSNGVSSRPSVVIVGPNNVGKRSILNRTSPFLEQEKWQSMRVFVVVACSGASITL